LAFIALHSKKPSTGRMQRRLASTGWVLAPVWN
jgi:hypothetical protein